MRISSPSFSRCSRRPVNRSRSSATRRARSPIAPRRGQFVVRDADGGRRAYPLRVRWFDWARDGRIVFAADDRVGLLDPATGRTTMLTGKERDPWFPRVSPDGKVAGFAVRIDGKDENDRFALRFVDTATGKALRTEPDTGIFHAWSPDGTRIAYFRSGGGAWDERELQIGALAVTNAGSGETRAVAQVAFHPFSHLWFSGDGKRLYFCSPDVSLARGDAIASACMPFGLFVQGPPNARPVRLSGVARAGLFQRALALRPPAAVRGGTARRRAGRGRRDRARPRGRPPREDRRTNERNVFPFLAVGGSRRRGQPRPEARRDRPRGSVRSERRGRTDVTERFPRRRPGLGQVDCPRCRCPMPCARRSNPSRAPARSPGVPVTGGCSPAGRARVEFDERYPRLREVGRRRGDRGRRCGRSGRSTRTLRGDFLPAVHGFVDDPALLVIEDLGERCTGRRRGVPGDAERAVATLRRVHAARAPDDLPRARDLPGLPDRLAARRRRIRRRFFRSPGLAGPDWLAASLPALRESERVRRCSTATTCSTSTRAATISASATTDASCSNRLELELRRQRRARRRDPGDGGPRGRRAGAGVRSAPTTRAWPRSSQDSGRRAPGLPPPEGTTGVRELQLHCLRAALPWTARALGLRL